MAAKGQFKAPVEPIGIAFERVMEAIGEGRGEVAIFMVGGKVMVTKKRSGSFGPNLERLRNNLVGVYDLGADARQVRADLAEFYRDAA